jgi:hypothetical protein
MSTKPKENKKKMPQLAGPGAPLHQPPALQPAGRRGGDSTLAAARRARLQRPLRLPGAGTALRALRAATRFALHGR